MTKNLSILLTIAVALLTGCGKPVEPTASAMPMTSKHNELSHYLPETADNVLFSAPISTTLAAPSVSFDLDFQEADQFADDILDLWEAGELKYHIVKDDPEGEFLAVASKPGHPLLTCRVDRTTGYIALESQNDSE